MKKLIMISALILLLTISVFYTRDNKYPSYDQVSLEEKVLIEDQAFVVEIKEVNQFVYEGDLLIEMTSPRSIMSNKKLYYYDDEGQLIKEELFKGDKIMLTETHTYDNGQLVESKRMSQSTFIDLKQISYEENMKYITFSDQEGIKSTSTITLNNQGEGIHNEVRDETGDITFTYERQYEGDLLIQSSEIAKSGYESHNTYEYNKHGDLIIQHTLEVLEGETNYIAIFEYDYNNDNQPIEQRYIVLKEVK